MGSFVDTLVDEICEKESILCVGLDPQPQWIPKHLFEENEDPKEKIAHAIVRFNQAIIEAVKDFAVAVKLRKAFYEIYGAPGIWAFEETIKFAKKQRLLVIDDSKRCDEEDTAKFYTQAHLGEVDVFSGSGFIADAMTVIPWTGLGLNHFIRIVKEKGKGIFVVLKTSFPPSSAIPTTIKLLIQGFEAWLVKQGAQGCEGSEVDFNNIGVVVGTYSKESLRIIIREIYPNGFFLVPDYGTHGEGAESAVAGVREDGLGVIVNSSDINHAYLKFKDTPAENFAEAARIAAEFSRNELNQTLEKKAKLPW